jgi:hypothetical protein
MRHDRIDAALRPLQYALPHHNVGGAGRGTTAQGAQQVATGSHTRKMAAKPEKSVQQMEQGCTRGRGLMPSDSSNEGSVQKCTEPTVRGESSAWAATAV